MSMIKKAKRSQAHLKLGISGASGSGKTYSSIILAKGINNGSLENVVLIDTENGSGNLYSDLGDYSVFDFAPPYSPQQYCKAIDLCISEGFKTIILDSASHEWEGAGGCLEIHQKFGGRFQDWAKVTPMHQAFINKILQTPAHFIVTMRRKTAHEVVQQNGKTNVKKLGTKEVQREGFEYELTCNFDINQEHLVTASKDRTGLFNDPTPFVITEETGEKILKWSKGE